MDQQSIGLKVDALGRSIKKQETGVQAMADSGNGGHLVSGTAASVVAGPGLSPSRSGSLESFGGASSVPVGQPSARPSGRLHHEAMEVFVRQAKAYMRVEEWEKAIAACEEALAVAPDVAEAHKLIGNVLQEMGRGIDSMGHYARALLVNPSFPEVYANLGSFYARQKAWEDAEIYYRKAIALRPESPEFLKPLTKVLEAQGKSDEATQLFAKRVTLEFEEATAAEHFLAGNFFLESGDELQAIESYRRAVERDETFAQAYRPLADLLEKHGDWQTATVYYRKVLQAGLAAQKAPSASKAPLAPKTPSAPDDTHQVRRISSGHAELQGLLRQAKQVHQLGDSKNIQNARASQNLPSEQSSPAVVDAARREAVSSAPPARPEEAAQYARSAQLQAQEQNWARAIEYYQESLKLNPQQPQICRELAQVLTKEKRLEEAAQVWFQAFKLEPGWATPEQYVGLGNTLIKQGKLNQGIACYQQAIRLKPNFVKAYEALGRVWEVQNEPARAMQAYRKALEVKGLDGKEGVTVKK